MSCLQAMSVLTIVAYCCTVMTFASKIKTRHSVHLNNLTVPSQAASNDSKLQNFSSSLMHEKSAIGLDFHPTKRQLQSQNLAADNFFERVNEPIEIIDDYGRDDGVSSRQEIFQPKVDKEVRIPEPYPFDPLPLNWASRIEPLSEYLRPRHVHHFRGFPVPVRVLKYERIPEPYYVPYKSSPDYTVLHVNVADPGLYGEMCSCFK